jgi:hypothetical protein
MGKANFFLIYLLQPQLEVSSSKLQALSQGVLFNDFMVAGCFQPFSIIEVIEPMSHLVSDCKVIRFLVIKWLAVLCLNKLNFFQIHQLNF